MARSKNGEAIGERGRSPSSRKKLRRFIRQRAKEGNLDEWRRDRAVLGYIEGRRVVDLAAELDVIRGTVNRWLQWYEAWVSKACSQQSRRAPHANSPTHSEAS